MTIVSNYNHQVNFADMSTESILMSLLQNDNRLNMARKINAFMQYSNLQTQQQSTSFQKAELLRKNITFFAGLAQAGIMAAAAVAPIAGAFTQAGSNATTAFAQAINKGGDAYIEGCRGAKNSQETMLDYRATSYNHFFGSINDGIRQSGQNSDSAINTIQQIIEKMIRQGEFLAG